jgi:HPt (histidine-containing phosphotransfer) domain-containing protein
MGNSAMIEGRRRKRAAGALQERLPQRPIDMFHLGRQALGDPGLEIEILRMFDEIIAVHFERLRLAVQTSDLLHHLHTLKAASAGVGAWALAEHAHVMEREIAAGAPKDSERIADIEMAVAEVREFIASQIALDERRWAEA